MTVSQLKEVLQTHPGVLRVVVNGYEGGFDDISPDQDLPRAHRAEHRRRGLGGPTRIRLGTCCPRKRAGDHR